MGFGARRVQPFETRKLHFDLASSIATSVAIAARYEQTPRLTADPMVCPRTAPSTQVVGHACERKSQDLKFNCRHFER